jgi:hypothetical protein
MMIYQMWKTIEIVKPIQHKHRHHRQQWNHLKIINQ